MVFEIVGWFGAGLILLAYLLAAHGRWPATGWQSAAVNLVAGVCLAVNGLYHGAFPSVALNSVWAAIGLATLVRARSATLAP
jgi:hypothetical protein